MNTNRMQFYRTYIASHETVRLYEGAIVGLCWTPRKITKKKNQISGDVSKTGIGYISIMRCELGNRLEVTGQ
jgi:hypothetical protein